MVGDYISTTFAGGLAFPAFAVASALTGSTLDEAISTVSGGLSVGGSANSASNQSNTSSSDPDTSSSITDQ